MNAGVGLRATVGLMRGERRPLITRCLHAKPVAATILEQAREAHAPAEDLVALRDDLPKD